MDKFKFKHTLRVRYSEIDGQRIVFNAHYLTYMDITISEYFRNLLQEDWAEMLSGKLELALVRTEIDFKSPARLDDLLDIYCRITEMGNSSLKVEFLITREKDQTEIVEARCVFVSFDIKTSQSTPIPESLRELIAKHEGIEL